MLQTRQVALNLCGISSSPIARSSTEATFLVLANIGHTLSDSAHTLAWLPDFKDSHPLELDFD